MDRLSEEEIIKYIELDIKITTEQINNGELFMTEELEKKRIKYLQGLLDLYNKEKEKNEELLNEKSEVKINLAINKDNINYITYKEIQEEE